ncbi:MAG: hypothetical protein JSW51_12665 [Gemmatimonadota bacterium]|nr:MAG: hypothetical protein JSW51_12665 [Gemmatimonadota bacterium]
MSRLYAGSSIAPNTRTLETIGSPYGLAASWFLDSEEPESIPVLGRIGLVPPVPLDRKERRSLREVLIPFAAWPMFELFNKLEARLTELDPTPDRPIVGEATADAFTFRLTTFLLQPLLNAERLGLTEVPIAADSDMARPEVGKPWVASLRSVGAMWEVVLHPMLKGEPQP